jgi:hypothetical protein
MQVSARWSYYQHENICQAHVSSLHKAAPTTSGACLRNEFENPPVARMRWMDDTQKPVSKWWRWRRRLFNVLIRECIRKFRTGRLERELQMVQLSANRHSYVTILWVSLVSFAAITLCVASQRVFVVYFVIDSVRKLLGTPSYLLQLLVKTSERKVLKRKQIQQVECYAIIRWARNVFRTFQACLLFLQGFSTVLVWNTLQR